jgi:putative phosphoesterase
MVSNERLKMRRILVFSDLHANRRALEDIIPVLQTVDMSVFCGDLLGYGKDIDYCIDFVLKNVDFVVAGDHERLATSNESLERQLPAVRKSTQYTRSKLSVEQIRLISSLPSEIWHDDFYITHSINDDYLRTERDFKRVQARMGRDATYAFFGHTHEPVLVKYQDKTIVNPGSVAKGRKGFHRGYAILRDKDVEFVNLEDFL